MPKATSPFLASLRGTLKGGPTFRDNPQTDAITMQTKPVPTDRRTAKQAAVRDAYSRLAWLWKNLSHLDKEPYQLLAEQRNLTPWNCWLSFHLPILKSTPKFYVPCSEGAGSTITDFSIEGETAKIQGAIWEEKNQFPTLYYDGIDDFIEFPTAGKYDPSNNLTIFCILNRYSPLASASYLIGDRGAASDLFGFGLYLNPTGSMTLIYGNGSIRVYPSSPSFLSWNRLNTVAVIKTGTAIQWYANGKWYTTSTTLAAIAPSTKKLRLGNSNPIGFPIKGHQYLTAMWHTAQPRSFVENLDRLYTGHFT